MAPKRSQASVFIPRPKSKAVRPPLHPADHTPVGHPSPAPVALTMRSRPLYRADFDDRTYTAQHPQQLTHQPPILYEGNLTPWLAEIEILLHAKCPLLTSINKLPLSTPSSQLDTSTRAARNAGGRETAHLIKTFVRPKILSRVPIELQNNIADFIPLLCTIAKPFRLMDLPPELRLNIFEFALYSPTPIILLTETEISAHRDYNDIDINAIKPPQPPLLAASRKLREEALPIYYSINEFKMDLRYLDGDTLVDLPRHQVTSWSNTHPRAVQHLRHLTVAGKPMEFPALGKEYDLPRELTVKFVPGKGLELVFSQGLNKACLDALARERLETQLELMEGYRRAPGLESGEAIVLFFRVGRFDWERLRGAMGKIGDGEA